jgi:hypothetical protein
MDIFVVYNMRHLYDYGDIEARGSVDGRRSLWIMNRINSIYSVNPE